MKFPTAVAVIAVVLLGASAGILYPLHGSMDEVRADLDVLETELAREAGVHDRLMGAHEQYTQLKERIRARAYRLCPRTPEAEHEFEGALQEAVLASGLASIRMDRRSEQVEAGHPCLLIDLSVDGEAAALQRFLVALETLPWVTRVLSLSVEAGGDSRRIQIQVAVMQERSA